MTSVAQLAKTVLITGTSSGIGLATALTAAQRGWTVVAGMRHPARAGVLTQAAIEAGVGDRIDVARLDVVDEGQVIACMDNVIADHGRLDALVNNAGAGWVGTIEQRPLASVRAAMEVNFFGVVNVTRAALPHLRATTGRLVTVTSVGGIVGQPFNEAYCAAKFAVEGFMESLAPVARTVGVSVSLVEPGDVATEFTANLDVDFSTLVASAGPYTPALKAYLGRCGEKAQSSPDAAASIVEVLDAERPPFRVQTSAWAQRFVGTKLADLDGSAVLDLTTPWVGHGKP